MNRTTLPLNDIVLTDRFRKDYGDLSLLKDSITRYGLIQPVVVNQDRVLVAGGRRYTAHRELGLATIDVVYKETLLESDRQEMEALENIARKSFEWQEETIAIARIYQQRAREAALSSGDWNSRLACELFGVSKGALSYVLIIAKKLEAELSLPPEKRKYHQYGSCFEAYRLGYLGEQEAKALAELARRHAALAASTDPIDELASLPAPTIKEVLHVEEVSSSPDLLAFEREKYERNPLNKTPFDVYWAEKTAAASAVKNTITLSPIRHGDSIDWMNDPDNKGIVSNIITDIPYGIDMSNLDQSQGGMQDVDRVVNEHDVDENVALIKKFFPAAFHCTRDKAFVITYCDVMQWQLMYDCAIAAGFAVQRWPLIWHKSSGAGNQCANYNTTKNYEILMLCRKPGTTLITGISSSILLASNEQAKKDCGHPFSKPYEITKTLANAISIRGDLFLEPFAGRGSITIELLRNERRVIAIEKQLEHYNALLENVKRFYLTINPNAVFK
jgi:ParB family chromosome partitioning protein